MSSSGLGPKVLWRVMDLQAELFRDRESKYLGNERALLEKLADVTGKLEKLERQLSPVANKSMEGVALMHETSAKVLHYALRMATQELSNRLGPDDALVMHMKQVVDEYKEYWSVGNDD